MMLACLWVTGDLGTVHPADAHDAHDARLSLGRWRMWGRSIQLMLAMLACLGVARGSGHTVHPADAHDARLSFGGWRSRDPSS